VLFGTFATDPCTKKTCRVTNTDPDPIQNLQFIVRKNTLK
jgi:hypothetical protein